LHLCRLYSTAGFTIDYLKHVIDVEKAKDVEADNSLSKHFTRVLQRFFSLGLIDIQDRQSLIRGLASIRVLGSQIIPYTTVDEIRELRELLGGVVSENELKDLLRLMTKREGKENICMVFTTEWQSVPLSLDRDTFILVDEASKSPMFHAFIPIARELLRSIDTDSHALRLRGLSVIGDV